MASAVTSIYNNVISAASAGFAPTNSADVSAIASSYQVVSATATQLYAGTAYVTSVNDNPLSASRAGNAANASMANSAYYDGTGRLISALPDSATVSAIASAYAESAASSKQDTLTFGYNAEDKISSIDGSALAGGEQVVTSLQYATLQSGAIVGYTSGGRAEGREKVFSARYYPNKSWYNYQSSTALASVGVTSFDSYITGNTEYPFEIFMIPYGAAEYGDINYISSVGSYMSSYGQFNDTSDFRIATGMATLSGYSAILDFNVTSLPFNTQHGSPMWGTAMGRVLGNSVNSQPVFAVVFGSGSDREGRCARITDGPKALGFGDITTVSAVSGINELVIAGGGGGGIDSATCSAIASAYAESAVSSKADSSALSSYALSADVSGKLDVTASSLFITSLPADLATTADVASAVSGKLDNSASGEWYPKTGNPSGFLTAHQSLAGYATEQYVDSSVSGKLDTSAYDSAQFLQTSQSGMFQPSGYYQPSGNYLSATESSNYYPSSNPSGFITGVDLTPYQLTADMSAYQLSGNYLSSTESANYQLTANMTGYIPVSALGTGEI